MTDAEFLHDIASTTLMSEGDEDRIRRIADRLEKIDAPLTAEMKRKAADYTRAAERAKTEGEKINYGRKP